MFLNKKIQRSHFPIAMYIAELRRHPELANMRLLARGNRLSITPVTAEEWAFINRHLAEN